MSDVADTSRATRSDLRLVAEWRSELVPPSVLERALAATPTSAPEVWLGDGADLVRVDPSALLHGDSTSSLQGRTIVVAFEGFILMIRAIVGGALVRLLQQGDNPVDLSFVRDLLSSTTSERV
jgi:hypothetical protein